MTVKPKIITRLERVEKKYWLEEETARLFLDLAREHIQADQYPQYTICNLYYDTGDYELIRRSIDKPPYKEKMRLRSYGRAGPEDVVFLELKKKYNGRVFKRRIALSLAEAVDYLAFGKRPTREGQVLRELDYFIEYYRPEPRVYLAYDRQAYTGVAEPGLRITFDRNIRFRTERLTLSQEGGRPLAEDGKVLLELKACDAYPLWLTHILSDLKLYPTSFSKYGKAYAQLLSWNARRDDQCSPALSTPPQAACR